MSVKYGILKKQVLTILEKQSMVSNGKNHFNVSGMVYLFNRIIKNILHNFIPHKIITSDDQNPPWITNSVRHLIQDKNEAYQRFKRSNQQQPVL